MSEEWGEKGDVCSRSRMEERAICLGVSYLTRGPPHRSHRRVLKLAGPHRGSWPNMEGYQLWDTGPNHDAAWGSSNRWDTNWMEGISKCNRLVSDEVQVL